jgi:hypothetical protein
LSKAHARAEAEADALADADEGDWAELAADGGAGSLSAHEAAAAARAEALVSAAVFQQVRRASPLRPRLATATGARAQRNGCLPPSVAPV